MRNDDDPLTPKLSPRQLRCKLVVKNTFLQVESRTSSFDGIPLRRACSDPEMYQAGALCCSDNEMEAGADLPVGEEICLTGFSDADDTASDITDDQEQGYQGDFRCSPKAIRISQWLKQPLQTNVSGATTSSSNPAEFDACTSQPKPSTIAHRTEQKQEQEEDVACVVGGVDSQPHVDHLECENARLVRENLLLKQQCMAAESATQHSTSHYSSRIEEHFYSKSHSSRVSNSLLVEDTGAAMVPHELPVRPSSVPQQAKALGLQGSAGMAHPQKKPMDESPSVANFAQAMNLQMAQMALLAGAWTNPQTPAGEQAMHLQNYQMVQMALLAGAMTQEARFPAGLPYPSTPSPIFWQPMQNAMPPQAAPRATATRNTEQQSQQARLKGPPIPAHISTVKGSKKQTGRNTTRNPDVNHADVALVGGVESQARPTSRTKGLQTVDRRTTIMIRNLPNQYTRNMLLDLIDTEGFAKLYDFVNLPIDFQSRSSLGYAFVNLVNNDVAKSFQLKFDGFSDWIIPSRKVCGVTWSGPHQGMQAHIERYRNSPVMHESVPDTYKPVVFKDGQRIPFPLPTRKLRAPRLRDFQPGPANGTGGGQFGQGSFGECNDSGDD